MKTTNVLLIRVNSTHELFHTRKAPEILRSEFPGARVVTLATPQTETLKLLKNDPRFDELLLFPSEESSGSKSPSAFRRFMAGRNIDVTVACYGAMDEINYQRHFLSLLLCPGRKLLMDKDYKLFPLFGPRGLWIFLRVATSAIWATASIRIAKAKYNFGRKFVRPLVADLGAKRDAGQIKKILWIRLDNIGDVVMSMPGFRALQANFPGVKIDVLIQSCSKPVFTGMPDIGEIFVHNPPNMLKGTGTPSSKRDWFALVSKLRRKKYDLAVETRGSATCRVFAYASGARLRLSPSHSLYELAERDNCAWLATHPVPMTDATGELNDKHHAVDNGLRVIIDSGLDAPVPLHQFDLMTGDREAVANTLKSLGVKKEYAVIHACSTDDMREWRPERFAAVADHLVQTHGLDVILTGAREDTEENAALIAKTTQTGRIHNAAGLVALRDLPALYERAKVMVTVDTGPMHIAAAVGVPIVSLFLPWLVDIHHPFGQRDGVLTPFTGTILEATESGAFSVWSGELLDGISTEKIVEAVDRKLAKGIV